MSRNGFDPGVPLAQYSGQADVLLMCNGCTYVRSLPLGQVIARLRERGVGDAQTGIRAVARLMTGPCPRCGAWKWETRPDFPSIPGQNGITPRNSPERKSPPPR